jgi:Bacterial Ig domain/Bacterial Ig-like domain
VVGTGTVGAGDKFDITTTKNFNDGTYSVTATDTSVDATQVSAMSSSATAIVGSVAPTGLAQKGTATNGGPIEITGTGDAVGDLITLYQNGAVVGTGTVGAGDTFDITTTKNFNDGIYSVTATDTSVDATQVSAMSAPATANVDPSVPMFTAVNNTPTNGVPLEVTLSGERGDTIDLYADGGATIVGSGIVGAGGTVEITTTVAFTDGIHKFQASETDGLGLTSPLSPIFAIGFNPSAPAITAMVGQPLNGDTVELQGTGEAGETVNLYADGGTTIVGTGIVGAGGTFDITTTATYPDGVHTFTATETNSKSLTSAASPAFTVDVDPFAPAITAVVGTPVNGGTVELQGTGEVGDTVNLYADGGTTIVGTGKVGAGGTFDITTTATFADGTRSFTATETDATSVTSAASSPAFTVAVESVAPTGLAQQGTATNNGPIEITGTGDAVGDLITLYQGGVAVGTGTVGAGDKFDITTTKNYPDGSYTLTATDTSVDGTQTSPMSSPVTALVEPVAPVITTLVGQQPLNGQTVELQGTGQAGDTVNLYADGGTTIVGTGTVDGTGHFDITTTATFPDGVHTFAATETDTAHVTSAASTPAFTVDVDPNAPTGLAVVGQPVNGQTVTVTGSGEAGDTVTLFNGATIVGTGTVGAGGTFSVTTTSAPHDGAYSFTATETDSAKLTSAASPLTVNVNPNAPAITTLVEVAVDGKVDLQGTGEAGETINLYADGNTSTIVGTGKVDGSGHFDITTTVNFTTGLHTFTATETDAAGLTSTPSNTAFAVNVDLFSPQRVLTDNSTPPSLPNITLASLVGDVPRGSLLPSGDGFGTGTGGGFSFNVVHIDPVLTTASDANVQINLALTSLEAPLGGDVVYVQARQADGQPLPDWLKFDPATGTFAGLPPDNAVASLAPDQSTDNNIVTGTLKQDFNDGSGRHAPGSSSITIEVLARDSKGNVAVTVFTIDLQPHNAGQHGWNMQPFGVERHASLATLSPELAAIEAAVRDVTRPVEPFAIHGMPVHHGDTISVGAHETVPVGRAGLTEQLASIGWRSMAAQRNALLASLQQGR